MAGNALVDVSRGGNSVMLGPEDVHPDIVIGMHFHVPSSERGIRIQTHAGPLVTSRAERLQAMAARTARRVGPSLHRMKSDVVVRVHRERLLQRVMAFLAIRIGMTLAAQQPVGLGAAAVAEFISRSMVETERVGLHWPKNS